MYRTQQRCTAVAFGRQYGSRLHRVVTPTTLAAVVCSGGHTTHTGGKGALWIGCLMPPETVSSLPSFHSNSIYH